MLKLMFFQKRSINLIMVVFILDNKKKLSETKIHTLKQKTQVVIHPGGGSNSVLGCGLVGVG